MTEGQLREGGSRQRLLLAVILLIAGYLRLHALAAPSLWLDEILGYDIASAAAKSPLWRWAWPFEAEHGPLYHATELAGRFLAEPEASARIWPAIFGIATVAAVWYAGLAISESVAMAAALLMALSPMGVYYSREGRPYALLMLLAACTLAFLLRGSRKAIAPLILMLYTSAIAIPYLISVAFAARKHRVILMAAVACTAAGFAMYRPGTTHVAEFSLPPHMNMMLLVFALVAAIGVRSCDRIVFTLAVLPAALTVVALVARDHWFASRYFTMALPATLLLVAAGVVAIGRKAWLLVAVILVIPGIPRALHEPFEKVDWRGTAEYLRSNVHDWDILILTNDWTDHSLGFYLRERPLKVNWINVHESVSKADELTRSGNRAWIVVDGFYDDRHIVEWANRYRKVSDVLRFNEGSSPSSHGR